VDDFLDGGAVIRPRAMCPNCRCYERHRVTALVIDSLARQLDGARLVIDVAPSPVLAPILRTATGGLYLSTDFDPAADRRDVMMQADLTRLPLPDGSVDVLFCSHVLEHIPDDAAALAEIRRVLSAHGVAFVVVPFRHGPTDEDPLATPDERIRRFGQADHVRAYGDDIDDRMRAAGLGASAATSIDLFGADRVHRYGLLADERFWFVSTSVAAPPALPRFDEEWPGEAAAETVARRTAWRRWRNLLRARSRR
jgi:SAM-dependent methyltransferase